MPKQDPPGRTNPHPNARNLAGTTSGWTGIEDYLVKHDGSMVRDYADDIDTLLVFAGLFSAILTAFVVQTYQLLQADNADTTNQLLAYGVASGGTSSAVPNDNVNATISTLLAAPAFVPSDSVRWINILFFLSLIISLSAAFFGILAKQWLREHMKWNSTLASPRENVLIRQIRFESLEKWRVTTALSTIPALLEIAMILFLVGVVILLKTLDDVVAVFVTAAVGVFLLMASMFTVFPVFFRRCPYKSPTAWACVVVAHVLSAPFVYLKNLVRWIYITPTRVRHHKGIWHMVAYFIRTAEWPSRPISWRERDLDTCNVQTVSPGFGPSRDARSAAVLELHKEEGYISQDGLLFQGEQFRHPGLEFAPRYLIRNVCETSILLRSLSWVGMASQDEQVLRYISQAIHTIHMDLPEDLLRDKWDASIKNVTDWAMLSALNRADMNTPFYALLPDLVPDGDASGLTVTGLRKMSGVVTVADGLKPPLKMTAATGVLYEDVSLELSYSWDLVDSKLYFVLAARVIAAALRHRVAEFPKPFNGDSTLGDYKQPVRRVYELVCLLRRWMPLWKHHYLAPQDDMWNFLGEEPYLDIWRGILGTNEEIRKMLDCDARGLRLSAYELAWNYAKVTPRKGKRTFEIAEGETGPEEQTALLWSLLKRDLSKASTDELSIFVHTVTFWLQSNKLKYIPLDSVTLIVNQMKDAAEIAFLMRDGRRCLVPTVTDVDWMHELSAQQKFLSKNCGHVFRRLMHAFEVGYNAFYLVMYLHDGPLTRSLIHEAMFHAHSYLDGPCEVAGCQWVGHTCTAPIGGHCPLLPLKKDQSTLPPPGLLLPYNRPDVSATSPGLFTSLRQWLTRKRNAEPKEENDMEMQQPGPLAAAVFTTQERERGNRPRAEMLAREHRLSINIPVSREDPPTAPNSVDVELTPTLPDFPFSPSPSPRPPPLPPSSLRNKADVSGVASGVVTRDASTVTDAEDMSAAAGPSSKPDGVRQRRSVTHVDWSNAKDASTSAIPPNPFDAPNPFSTHPTLGHSIFFSSNRVMNTDAEDASAVAGPSSPPEVIRKQPSVAHMDWGDAYDSSTPASPSALNNPQDLFSVPDSSDSDSSTDYPIVVTDRNGYMWYRATRQKESYYDALADPWMDMGWNETPAVSTPPRSPPPPARSEDAAAAAAFRRQPTRAPTRPSPHPAFSHDAGAFQRPTPRTPTRPVRPSASSETMTVTKQKSTKKSAKKPRTPLVWSAEDDGWVRAGSEQPPPSIIGSSSTASSSCDASDSSVTVDDFAELRRAESSMASIGTLRSRASKPQMEQQAGPRAKAGFGSRRGR